MPTEKKHAQAEGDHGHELPLELRREQRKGRKGEQVREKQTPRGKQQIQEGGTRGRVLQSYNRLKSFQAEEEASELQTSQKANWTTYPG